MYKLYQATQIPDITKGIIERDKDDGQYLTADQLIDNASFDFNMDKIRHFLCYATLEADNKSFSDPSKLGIRVYLGAKTDADGIIRSTVFLAPTYFDNGGYQLIRGIKPFNYGNSGRPPQNYKYQ